MSKKQIPNHDKLDKLGPPKKRSVSAPAPVAKDKRLKIVSGLANTGGVSKSGLAKVLRSLNNQGLLTDPLSSAQSSRSYRRQVQDAVEDEAFHVPTPYGPLIQNVELPVRARAEPVDDRTPRDALHYVNPFALLYYLASINAAFFHLLKKTAEKTNHRLRLCLYVDEVNPGNPLAPDPQKLLQAIYWTIVDFPSWFLRRKDSWFCFSLVRTMVTKRLAGYVSELMKIALHVFFPPSGTSFDRGCHVQHNGDGLVVTATFEGILADEKALKEVFGVKGAGGNIPCSECLNIRNRWVDISGQAALQHHWDPDLSKRRRATDVHLKLLVKRLVDASIGPTSALKALETKTGVNYTVGGVLFDDHLARNVMRRGWFHYIRDWMHTLVSNGVAGSHLALMCQALIHVGCSLEIIRTYIKRFTLPWTRNHGKISDMYFKDALMETDHVRHFASDVLGMVPLLTSFLLLFVHSNHP